MFAELIKLELKER